MSVLAIDQGTTSTRALLVDESGHAHISHSAKHRQFYPGSGWVEHDPKELIRDLRQCLDSAAGIEAIGIDNQGESCLAWHAETKEPVCPVIVWQDNRSQGAIEDLVREGAGAEVMARAGLPLDSYFAAAKLAWILKHVEQAATLRRQGKLRLGTTDAYFLDTLGNRFVTDITTASRTSLLNMESGQWDEELCRLFGVPIELLPEIVATTGEIALVTTRGREVPVTASVVDQQASLYGHGCRTRGDAKITFGTGAFALALTGQRPLCAPEQGLLPTVAWRLSGQAAEYALDGGVYNAGSAIEWARGIGLFQHYDEINVFDAATAVERELVFVPALSGLACPHWDRRAAGLWIGLTLDTTPRDMLQALLEGIAFRAAEVVRAMGRHVSMGETISVDGGVSKNPYFCQFLANTLGKEVVVKRFAELTAIGTAQLAGASDIDFSTLGNRIDRYRPRCDMAAAIERFDEAVSRASQWRRNSPD